MIRAERPGSGVLAGRRAGAAKFSVLLLLLSVSSMAVVLLAVPSVPMAHAAQPVPVSRYFGNAYNSTQSVAVTVSNSTQVVDIRFTASYNGTAVPRFYVGQDFYLSGAEYDVVIGIQTDNSGVPSGHFLGAFVWNVSSGLCNGCGGWVSPGFAAGAGPLNHTIALVSGDVYDLVLKYYNGTITSNPQVCYEADCLYMYYIGGTNFQQQSLNMQYDPNQEVLYCGSRTTCAAVPGANAVYALDFNGSAWVQGQTEVAIENAGIGAAKGGSGLDSYQGERFWMAWDTVSLDQLQVLLSRVGNPTGYLNVVVWNFTAASPGEILDASDPQLILNQTVVQNLTSIPSGVDQAFNFSLSKNVVFQTGNLYQVSLVIYGNTSAVNSSDELDAATTTSEYPNPLNWDGTSVTTTPACEQYAGGCAGFSYSGNYNNTSADANQASDLIFIMKIASSTVSQPISVTMGNSAPSANVSVNGCYATPSTFTSDGESQVIQVLPSCRFTLSFANSGNTRDGFSVSQSYTPVSQPLSTCATGKCTPVLLKAYEQVQNTYVAKPTAPGTWDAALTIPVSGTQLGVADKAGCSISTVSGGGVASCAAWFDYGSQAVVASPILVRNGVIQSTERWVSSTGGNFTQSTGGNEDTTTFIDQFQVSFSSSPPGTGTTSPSGSDIWENYGTLPVNATPSGGYLFDRWSSSAAGITFVSADDASTVVTIVGSGAVTATFSPQVTQTITLSLAEGQGTPASFILSGCSVSPSTLPGDGQPHSVTASSSCELTITAEPSGLPNLRYSFDSEDTASNTTSVATCAEHTCSEFSATYYEQVSELFAYTIVGGAAPYVLPPALSFTSLGTPATYLVTEIPTAQWLDYGSAWSLVNPLSGSAGGARWFAPSGTSGTATAGGEQTTAYQHQYAIEVSATPASCGTTSPSGSNWESAGNEFQVTGSAASGCTFSGWEATGLVMIAESGQPSTTAFADSNGTLIASFARSGSPASQTSTVILAIAGTAGVGAAVAILFTRSRRVRDTGDS